MPRPNGPSSAHSYNKRTVHIPGSHALPPGINTNMAWELGYARKRMDVDTNGIESTVHPNLYQLREKGVSYSIPADAAATYDPSAQIAEAMKHKLVVSKGADCRALDQLNPYFMHLELIKRRYAIEGDDLWANLGRPRGRVPIGGWPSGVEFEMGVHYMPGGVLVDRSNGAQYAPRIEVANATTRVIAETIAAQTDADVNEGVLKGQDGASHTENEGEEEEGEKRVSDKEGKEESVAKNDSSDAKYDASQKERVTTLPELPKFVKDQLTHNEQAKPSSAPPQTQRDQTSDPYNTHFSPFFPLPALSSTTVSNPSELPQGYAANRRYNSNPVHPDALQSDPSHIAIHAKYIDTFNTAALVNGRPTAIPIPGTTRGPPPPSSGAKPLLPSYSNMAAVPLTTTAIAALNGLGALGYAERYPAQPSARARQQEHYNRVMMSKGSNHEQSPGFTSLHAGTVGAVLPPVNLKGAANVMGPARFVTPILVPGMQRNTIPGPGERFLGNGCIMPDSVHDKGFYPFYHGLQPCLDAESADKHWRELLKMDRPHGRRGWNHVGRDHLANFSQGMAPVSDFPAEKSLYR
ncbi:hypothetical protein BC830DRAFT_1170656 [Chytriomyces sp. MP71]|nr:hypothetical protein BC830DRAFT_1170656 [Chytriomyces sp. MP71]